MCEFCIKHGEGEKWYLNAKNYSNDLLSDVRRRMFTKEMLYWIDKTYRTKFKYMKMLPFDAPIIGDFFKKVVKQWFINKHWGQVVPIEDVEKILDITASITRIPCICRKITTGKEVRTCFLLSMDPRKIGVADILDQSFFGGPDIARFEKVENDWVLNYIKESESKGMIHTVWTFTTPLIGGLCNCDLATGCLSMKMYKEASPIAFRSEYVAVSDRDSCVGCRECIKVCQFTAIKIDVITNKIEIDARRCYGCGICRAVCGKSALSLQERRLVPEAANLW